MSNATTPREQLRNPQTVHNSAASGGVTDLSGALSRAGKLPPDLSSGQREWDGFLVQRRVFRPHDMQLPPLRDHLIAIHAAGTNRLTQRRDGQTREVSLAEGGAVLMPAGQESEWYQEGEGRVLQVGLGTSFIQNVVEQSGESPDQFELLNNFGIYDAHLTRVASALASELENEGLGGRVYAESLATVLAIHLLRNYSSLAKDPVHEQSSKKLVGLPTPELRRAVEYVEDNLAQDLTLSEIAGVVNVSSYHFARLFKQSTGVPPHQYVIRRRVERARGMLASTDLTVGEVALAVGFSNHGHLSRHFKRIVGTTPGVYRAQVRR